MVPMRWPSEGEAMAKGRAWPWEKRERPREISRWALDGVQPQGWENWRATGSDRKALRARASAGESKRRRKEEVTRSGGRRKKKPRGWEKWGWAKEEEARAMSRPLMNSKSKRSNQAGIGNEYKPKQPKYPKGVKTRRQAPLRRGGTAKGAEEQPRGEMGGGSTGGGSCMVEA